MSRLAVTPLSASVATRGGRVELDIGFFEGGQTKTLRLMLTHPEFGTRECEEIARNIARRINRDTSMLPEAT